MPLSASVKSRLQYQHETIHELLKGFSEEYLFERYVADNDPAFLASCRQPVATLLANLQKQRNTIIEYLLAVPYETLGKTGRHPKYGLLTMTEWTEFFLLHEAHHLFSIFMLTRSGT